VRPFRDRNPIPLGIIGVAALGLVVLLVMNLRELPLVGGGDVYSAAFAEAAGLKSGEEVRVAGVKVGEVEKVDLEGDHVRVDFRVDDGVRFGTLSRVEIKLKTILGAHYLALQPRGPGQQSPARQIPVSRTAVPFEVVPALSQLSRQVGQVDTKQLARAFDTLASTFENSPEEIRASLRGLRRLSASVATRDEELHELLGRAKNVTGLLADRSEDISKLVRDGDTLLKVVLARRAVIHQLLINTVGLSQHIDGLIRENRRQFGPALKNLRKVIDVLRRNERNLESALPLLSAYVNQLTDATGTGRWFDGYLQNLVPVPFSLQPPGGGAGGERPGAGAGNAGKQGRDGARPGQPGNPNGGGGAGRPSPGSSGGTLPWLP
jgi:virulence factor Mce-like protein